MSRDPQTDGPSVLVTVGTNGRVTISAHATQALAIEEGERWQKRNADNPNWIAHISKESQ